MSKKKLSPEQILQAIEFSERLTDANLWIHKAQELLAAARVLEKQVERYWSKFRVEDGRVVGSYGGTNVQATYFMLVAYAAENYCKAVLVHTNRDCLRNRVLTKIPVYINEHNLLNLARQVKLELSLHEEELLSRLSRNSIWAARYPVPTGPDGLRAIEQFSDGKAHLTAYLGPHDVSRIHHLLDHLSGHVRKEIGNPA